MNGFALAAALITVAAASGYVNHKLLRLPASTGTLVVALASSLAVVSANALFPALELRATVGALMSRIDFTQILMRNMLCFLLFAGALHLDVEGLLDNRWTIGVLATAGVAMSTGIVGGLLWAASRLTHAGVSPMACFVFGALISPTDPVAVMGLLKELRAPRALEAQIGGESLFNDGVGVVVFLTLASLAGLTGPAEHFAPTAAGTIQFLLRQVIGGAALGAVLGYAACATLRTIDDHPLELLITLALVMSTYAVSFALIVSGPIAVVVAGLLVGSQGRRVAMTKRTEEHVDAFWNMIDGILNTVLFLLLGLQVFGLAIDGRAAVAGLVSVFVVLLARLASVALAVAALRDGSASPGLVPVLTWAGLRGGLSVAMALSLPPFAERDLILTSTYSVVVFSILVQGTTVRGLLTYYGIGRFRDTFGR